MHNVLHHKPTCISFRSSLTNFNVIAQPVWPYVVDRFLMHILLITHRLSAAHLVQHLCHSLTDRIISGTTA